LRRGPKVKLPIKSKSLRKKMTQLISLRKKVARAEIVAGNPGLAVQPLHGWSRLLHRQVF
jgi:hypothetical protein